MDLYLASVIGFVVVLAILLFRDRKNVEVKSYLMFIRRTQRGRGLIERIAEDKEWFWNKIGIISTLVGFGGMGFAFYYLAKTLLEQIIGAPAAGGPRLVIPVPSQEAAFLPGVIGVPFWSWIISIGLLMVVHEGSHGIMVKTVKSKIESLGVVLLAVIPGAFVEPDEEDLKEKSWLDQLKVYSAGSFANFCLGGLVFVILSFVFLPIFTTPAIGYQGYVNASEYNRTSFPAQEVNMTGQILSIDGQRTDSFDKFKEVLNGKRPGDTVSIETTDDSYQLTLEGNPDNESEPFLGVSYVSESNAFKEKYRKSGSKSGLDAIYKLLNWIFILNIGIGIMNLLPLKPLDGGLMVEALSEKYFPEKSKVIVRGVSALSLTLLLSIFLYVFL
ncbi:MAG: site-2 protease family protein [Candidatus Aenigmatarchaeota archaeon]